MSFDLLHPVHRALRSSADVAKALPVADVGDVVRDRAGTEGTGRQCEIEGDAAGGEDYGACHQERLTLFSDGDSP